MGRRMLELKPIEDKSSRQVTFSKRRNGLLKKARELSVLCDVEIAVFVFSGRGKRYEFCTGDRLFEEHKVDQLDVTELTQLEHKLDAIQHQIGKRKSQLMMNAVTALHEKMATALNEHLQDPIENQFCGHSNTNQEQRPCASIQQHEATMFHLPQR